MWGLKFNLSKCYIISFIYSAPKFLYPYKIGEQLLARVPVIKDLGINIASNLKWKEHINTIVKNAFKRLWLIIRTVGFDCPSKLKRTLYLALVRSVIEFGSVIWCPTTKELIEIIESVQRKATNIITNNAPRWTPNYKNYKERLLECNILPTTFRREITDLIIFLRSRNTNTGYNCTKHVTTQISADGPATRNRRRGLNLQTRVQKHSTSAQFFPTRLTKLWNSLPLKIREKLLPLDDKEKIKRVLLPYYFNRLRTSFDPNDTCTWVHCCYCSRCSAT